MERIFKSAVRGPKGYNRENGQEAIFEERTGGIKGREKDGDAEKKELLKSQQ